MSRPISESLSLLSETLGNCKTNLKEKEVADVDNIKISDVDEKIAEIKSGESIEDKRYSIIIHLKIFGPNKGYPRGSFQLRSPQTNEVVDPIYTSWGSDYLDNYYDELFFEIKSTNNKIFYNANSFVYINLYKDDTLLFCGEISKEGDYIFYKEEDQLLDYYDSTRYQYLNPITNSYVKIGNSGEDLAVIQFDDTTVKRLKNQEKFKISNNTTDTYFLMMKTIPRIVFRNINKEREVLTNRSNHTDNMTITE